MRRSGRLAVVALTAVVGLGLAGPVWAGPVVPAPVPTDPGSYGASSWQCQGSDGPADPVTGATSTSQSCAVTGWAPTTVTAPPQPEPTPTASAEPTPQPVQLVGPVQLDPGQLPLPVVEQSPTSGGAAGWCSAAAGPSPSSSPEPDTSPAPPSSAAPSPSASPGSWPCVQPVSLEQGQAFGLWLFLGAIFLVLTVPMLVRFGRAFRG